jgi:hypothetical protein
MVRGVVDDNTSPFLTYWLSLTSSDVMLPDTWGNADLLSANLTVTRPGGLHVIIPEPPSGDQRKDQNKQGGKVLQRFQGI